jgi:hypothetical protein
MMKILVLFLILVSFKSFAMPTAEGLFRNANNKDLAGNLIVITAMAERIEGKRDDSSELENEKIQIPVYYKWLLSLEREKIIDLIQVSYNDAQMKEQQVVATRYLPELSKVVALDNSLERSLFYGLLGVFTLNSSRLITPVFTKHAQGFVSNQELMSRDKVHLYKQYKNYLENRQQVDEEANSPLKPEDPEKAKIVEEILTSPMYRDAENVKLERINGKLMWVVDFKNLTAKFSNEDHRLRRLEYQSPMGDIDIRTDEFILFNGSHELPKTMIYKDLAGKRWRLRFLGLSHLNNRNTPFTKRAEQYMNLAKENAKKIEMLAPNITTLTPPFIF